MGKKKLTTRKMVLTALLAAMTVVGSCLQIKIPAIVGVSRFHLGNIMCALSGIMLGPWLGGLAAGMGSAIFDMLDPMYISDCWITFLTKGAYGLIVGLVFCTCKKKLATNTYVHGLLATLAGALTYAALYLSKVFFYDGMLIKGLSRSGATAALIEKLPATAFNAVVALIAAPLLGVAIAKALKRAHLSPEQ